MKKNRTLIGIVCVILAVVITFVVSPLVNKATEGKTEVVSVTKDIPQGNEITADDVNIIKIAKGGLPEKAITKTEEVIGKYVISKVYKGDFITPEKIVDTVNSADSILSNLKGDKVAMSITISSLAGGLSGKLQNGDIVSINVTNKENETTIPPTLKYVKVITTTTAGGVDENDVVPNDDGTFDLPTTVTLLVNVNQATELANYEKNASMHIALVCRGDEARANEYLKVQDDFLDNTKGGTEDV